ncbi:MAG: HXXEE domain-containing protein [Microthrixaceae bacterium]
MNTSLRPTTAWDASPGVVSDSDMVAATALWAAMATAFVVASHGASLRVTFLPGVCAAYALTVWLWRTKQPLPSARDLWPWYLTALAVQFIHFAEENATGFATEFPELYGGAPYPATTFTTFNMVSYAVFTAASIALWRLNTMKLLVPLLFFCVYGALGNAIAHSLWTIRAGGYFPGWVTSLAFWPLGLLILHRLLGDRWQRTAAFALSFGAILATPLVAYATHLP